MASVVVFLVALPLCMGIAIASGMPPAAGLITGVVGGIVVGLIGGAPLQVSGPAAGLSVMVYEIVRREDAGHLSGIEVIGSIVFIAGLAQLLAGLLKFGQWFRAVSPAVIRGMLTGIGVLIFAGQFHVMVDDLPRGSGLQNLISVPESIWKGVVPLDGSRHHWAARIGILTILLIVAWKTLTPKKWRVVPAPLVAVAIATGVTAYANLPINLVPIPDQLIRSIDWPQASDLQRLLNGQILAAGLAMAFVASAETLLCASAVDQLHSGPRTKYDRELAAQGIGNMLCGVMSALPMTGVIVRSAANVEAGARSRWSAVLHGTWLMLLVVAFPHLLRAIPTSSLAALLVFTGYKLVDFKAIKELRPYGRGEVATFIATAATIVFADLLTGVLVGVAISIGKLLYTFSHLEIQVEDQFEKNRTTLHLRGAATFVRLPQLAAALEEMRPSTELHVHLERLNHIDHACLDLFMNWEKQHESTGGRLVMDWDFLTARFHREEVADQVVTSTGS
jgi:MFS superfamily sulfate permease-like transporter